MSARLDILSLGASRCPALASVALLATLLIGCNGGGGGGGGGGASVPDTMPPTVSVTYPADAVTGVFVDGAINAVFSEPMNAATINTSNFTLKDATNASVLASVSYSGKTATIKPTNPLGRSALYTATITTGVKDLAGNAMTADRSWSFTTEMDAWQSMSMSGAPAGRAKPTAVWTGTRLIVWGGQVNGGVTNTGGLYNPVADTWSATATNNAPLPRLTHTAIWTGNKMIVWGGWDGSSHLNDGAAYDLAINSWGTITTPSGFVGRGNHTTVWTGTEMIVWGGNTNLGFSNTGAAYNPSPAANSWRPLSSSALLERTGHTAVWTDTEMIVWGGYTGLDFTNTGAAYNPTTNKWRAIAAPPAGFLGRAYHTAVWTGGEMIVWGGNTSVGVVNTGAAYNPATNSWRLISMSGAPTPRLDHTAIWTGPTGVAMVVWGGEDVMGTLFNDGGRYDPVTDGWRTIDLTSNVPTGRFDHSVAWTGSEMIVWGGNDRTLTNTGARYAP
jgi:N-acetylneuraminic acid mutarotase